MAELFDNLAHAITTASTWEDVASSTPAANHAFLIKHLTYVNQDTTAARIAVQTLRSGDANELEKNMRFKDFPPSSVSEGIPPGATYSEDVHWFIPAGGKIRVWSSVAAANFVFDYEDITPQPF